MGKVHSIYGRLVGYTLQEENRSGIYILYIGVLVRGYRRKMPLGRTEHRRQAIIKMDLKKWGTEWTHPS